MWRARSAAARRQGPIGWWAVRARGRSGVDGQVQSDGGAHAAAGHRRRLVGDLCREAVDVVGVRAIEGGRTGPMTAPRWSASGQSSRGHHRPPSR
ncbi:hypothetical protein [Streptomyces sp. NPDC004546]|uniref:hypothetical protein n=1 Tax=unclassified Streptomyces TaxID=2593676 RepID=UPI0033A0AAC4